MKRSMRALPYAVCAALATVSGGASGSGFQLMEQNASGLGNAYAGQAAAAENASTVFWNPAGMTRLPGRQLAGAVNLIKSSVEFTDSGASRTPLNQPLGPGGGDGGDAGDLSVIPNFYATWQMSPQWWLGLGITVPFGLKTEYDENWIGRFQGRLAEIQTIDINPSIAYKISDTVAIGAGISYQMGDVTVKRSQLLPGPTEGRIHVDIDDDAVGFNVGLMFSPSPSTRIGLTYRSVMDYKLTGTLNFSGVPVIGTASNNVQLEAKLPDTWSVAFAHQLSPQWEILGDATFTRWSTIKALPLVTTSASPLLAAGATADTFNFQFKDTYRVGIGANYKRSSDFTWKFGVAYDKSPVEDEFRTVTLPDNDRTWLGVGGKYRMSKQMTLDFGYAHLFVKDSTINQLRGVGVPPLQGNVVGNYENAVDIFSMQLSYSF